MTNFTSTSTTATPSASLRASWAARLVLPRFSSIQSGTFVLEMPGEEPLTFGDGEAPVARVRVLDTRFWTSLVRGGSIGAGEAYAKGWWDTDDLTSVIRVFARNKDAMTGIEAGLARLARPFRAAYHALRRNTERGSRKNIEAHYDLSNDFFALFLDDTMTYSCGVFEDENSTLREASVAKIDRLCHKLQLRPEDHLLEIGTGWGALAVHAAREYGCRVTTTTISREQHDFAAARIREHGLEDRIELLFQDYRRLEGQYDKLVSVEMIEAVGHEYYGEFFGCCSKLLKPGGLMALQAITIEDQSFDEAARSVDFIQRYIFPGSCIPSVTALCSSMTRSSDLRLVDLDDIGMHYVRTLTEWHENLKARWQDARELGYSDEFLRLWEFYFGYCAGGFAERHISDVHMLLRNGGQGVDG